MKLEQNLFDEMREIVCGGHADLRESGAHWAFVLAMTDQGLCAWSFSPGTGLRLPMTREHLLDVLAGVAEAVRGAPYEMETPAGRRGWPPAAAGKCECCGAEAPLQIVDKGLGRFAWCADCAERDLAEAMEWEDQP